MEEQPSVHPAFKGNTFFSNGSAARPVPPGTVARAAGDSPGFPYADVRTSLPAWSDPTHAPNAIPFPITRDVLLRGQEHFNIYCSECHGRLGNGNGMIVQRGLTPPPSFHLDRLRAAPDAHFYQVISNGYGAMFSYNDRVKTEDRWMIIAYIRALQASSAPENTLAHLSDADRRELGGKRP
ncbi:MAG TPA: cytochrome c [Tepidisphaeraceae bacterium]|nr:cytochrome c [Tepidisphaeraceae bacterium]